MHEEKGNIILDKGDRNKYFGYLDDKIIYPRYLQKIIVEVILEGLGIEYQEEGDKLRGLFNLIPEESVNEWIEVINNLYIEEEKVDYKNIEYAYLIYYLQINTFKIHRLLDDLLVKGLVKTDVQVLDIGCGPGSASVGMIEFYRILAENSPDTKFRISLTLLDAHKNFLDIANRFINKMVEKLPDNLLVEIYPGVERVVDEEFKLEYLYDYIIISNLLNGNELDENFIVKDFFKEVIASLDDKGSILIIEPGDQIQCERLKKIRNAILKKFNKVNIYSPCNNIWGEEKEYKCTCFSHAHLRWNKSILMKLLIHRGLVKQLDEIAFNYLILRTDGKTKYRKEKNQNFIKLKDVSSNQGKKINVVGIVRCVMQVGNYWWVSICDGSIDLAANKHIFLSIDRYNNELMDKYGELIMNMNVGEKIRAENVKCEKMWKYPKSYLLHIDKNSKIQGLF